MMLFSTSVLFIGPYRVIGRLASGGTAHILLALENFRGTPRMVCLKTPLPAKAANPSTLELFFTEGRIAKQLRHPGCVTGYEVGEANGTPFFVMEHVFGETLAEVIGSCDHQGVSRPWKHFVSIVASIAEALHYLHELRDPNGEWYQIVHRDVSPQNVMITYDGRAKLLDLGIAKGRTGRPGTTAGIVRGKYAYMSPEQISGQPVDRRTDVYSLGIVLLESLTFRRLYSAATPEQTAALIAKGPPPLRSLAPELPAALEAICAKALAFAREDRFATGAEMAAALRTFLATTKFPIGPDPIAELQAQLFRERIQRRVAALAQVLQGEELPPLEELSVDPFSETNLVRGVAKATEPGDGTGVEIRFLTPVPVDHDTEPDAVAVPLPAEEPVPAEAQEALAAPELPTEPPPAEAIDLSEVLEAAMANDAVAEAPNYAYLLFALLAAVIIGALIGVFLGQP